MKNIATKRTTIYDAAKRTDFASEVGLFDELDELFTEIESSTPILTEVFQKESRLIQDNSKELIA